MPVYHGLTLADIINVKVLQEIQDKFSDATGLAAVIVDSAGQPVTTPSNFTRLCNLIRSTPQGLSRCMGMLYIMTNYIVEIAMANIAQKQLMDELKAKADLEKILRETELKALQSQVNPHFLFNTLNTIARLALLEEAPRTQEVVYALSDLLRNNLRNIDEMVTVDEEVQYIKNYLLIQKMRFGDRIQATIEIPKILLGQKIPVLTLQPLVENAIIHGLEPKRDGGTIFISGGIHGNQYELSITDTGVGITQNQIERIFRNEKRIAGKGQTTGLGIINVYKRIQHYFGPQCGLGISGEQDKGTTVKISLPYEFIC